MNSTHSRAKFSLVASVALALQAFLPVAHADNAAFAEALKAKGAEVTMTQGDITGINFKTKAALTEAELQQIHQLSHLKTISFGLGFDDVALAALKDLPELESFGSNGLDASDAGIRVLGTCKKLKSASFFHPGKKFTGAGLDALADSAVENITVAGSTEINDDGMAAIAKIKHLKAFRVWHSGVSVEGVKKLQALPELKNLTLGQRLANKPPTTVSDEAVTALAGCASLEFLTVQEARLTLPALSQLKKLTHLKKLKLDGIDISDADLAALKQQLPPTVSVDYTAPNEGSKKRIDGLFGPK